MQKDQNYYNMRIKDGVRNLYPIEMTCEYGLEKVMKYLRMHREFIDRELAKINKEALEDDEIQREVQRINQKIMSEYNSNFEPDFEKGVRKAQQKAETDFKSKLDELPPDDDKTKGQENSEAKKKGPRKVEDGWDDELFSDDVNMPDADDRNRPLMEES